MSQRFIRCSHCGLPHDVSVVVCPITKKPLSRARPSSPQQRVASKHPSTPPPKTASSPPGSTPRRAPAGTSGPPRGTVAQQSHANNAAPPGRIRSTRDLIGRVLGEKYMVRSVLGEGGMGTVFEAEHMGLRRAVAVKVLHPAEAKKKEAVKRFHQEARAAGSIGHPNICEVYDFGTLEDGSPYLVMEKLVGRTLADRIQAEGGLPFEDVIDILVQVLSGLIAAHEKGVVHRDIKPENIFLTMRAGIPPVAKVLDFGVSKMIHPVLSGEREEDLDLTRTGMVMGTPYYMAPEQARGDRNLDARVDLWACGVILYEALTGRRPFTAANYNALLLQILTTKPRPARELRPAIPLGFDEVIERSLARSREDRYPSGGAFQKELQNLRRRLAADSTAVTRLAPPPSSAKRSSRRAPRAEGEVVRQEQPQSRPDSGRRPPSRRETEPPSMRDLAPSSVEIPVTFSTDTPLSNDMIPIDEASRMEPLPEADLPPPRARLSRFPNFGDGDDDATQIGMLEQPPVDHDETTRRHGSELESAIADARRRILKDTYPQVGPPPPPGYPGGKPMTYAASPAPAYGPRKSVPSMSGEPRQGVPSPRQGEQIARRASSPAIGAPSRNREVGFGSVPPPPAPSAPARRAPERRALESSVPAPPPPPRPMRHPSNEDDVDDEAYTQILSGNFSPLRYFEQHGGPDDTVKMDGELEDRVEEAKERLLTPDGRKRPR